jgi:hypothetical protein
VAPSLLLLALSLWLPSQASAQWVTDANARTITTTTDKVGIGTTTPGTQLEIRGSQPTATIDVTDSSSFSNVLFRENAAPRAALQYVGQTFSTSARRGGLELVTFWANPITLWTSGVERLRVTPSGNVGVGTASPSSLLHLSGAARPALTISDNTAARARLFRTTGGQSDFSHNVNYDGAGWALDDTTVGGSSLSLGNNFVGINQWAAGSGSITTPFYINSSGNVGVGTTNPTGRLHVTYGTNAWYFLSGDSPNNKGLNAGASWATANGTQLTFNAYGGGTELITEIGPNYAVHGGTGVHRYAINGGKKSPVIQMSADAGSISLFGESGSGAAWRTPTLNLGLHVGAGGKVGVGTAAPDYRLDVDGAVRSRSGGFVFPDGTVQTTAAAGGASQWTEASGVTGIQYGGGSVGVGTPSPRGKLEVAGGPLFLGDMGNAGWGDVVMRGRVISASNNIHISPPGGTGVYIDSNYREAGGGAGPVNLHVSGDVIAGGQISAKYQDVAEWVPSVQKLSAGTVVVLDAGRSNHVLASSSAYDTKVAGVVSEQPGVILGEGGAGKVMVATTGRVKVKVDASRGAIRIGDLIVTSDVEGVAMKSEPVSIGGRQLHAPGTIIGKALEPLEKGVGEILVLLSLQ